MHKKISAKHIRLLSITALMLLLFSFAQVSAAQAAIEKLDVTIKPEFDKEKAVFLNLVGELEGPSADKLDFYMPKTLLEDDTLHFCAIVSGEHQCQLREKEVVGNFNKISVPMPSKEFTIEGYFESIEDSNGKKTLDYTFKAGDDINDLQINITQPKNSKNFTVSPTAREKGTDDNNLNNAVYSYTNVKKGKEYNFKISYQKEGWSVAFSREGMGQAATALASTGGSDANPVTIIGIVLLALALTGGGFYAFSKMSQSQSGSRKVSIPKGQGKGRFCTNCGSRLSGPAKFCPSCGKRI